MKDYMKISLKQWGRDNPLPPFTPSAPKYETPATKDPQKQYTKLKRNT